MLRRRMRVPAAEMKDLRDLTRRASPFFILRFKDNDLPHDRFAVVVSAKTAALATARHRLKRRAAAKLRRRSSEKHPGRNRDIILSVLPPAAALPRKRFLAELEALL